MRFDESDSRQRGIVVTNRKKFESIVYSWTVLYLLLFRRLVENSSIYKTDILK